MKLNIRIFVVLALFAASAGLVAHTASARHTEATRPGWGFGDMNHIHTGPPGQSVRSVRVTQSNTANVNNNVSIVSNTGGNSGGGTSGNISVVSRIRNFLNFNFASF